MFIQFSQMNSMKSEFDYENQVESLRTSFLNLIGVRPLYITVNIYTEREIKTENKTEIRNIRSKNTKSVILILTPK